MLLCLPSCGQNTPPTEETALSRQTPAKGRIAEIILDGTASRMPVSASISTGTGAAAFQITDKTLFLDGQTGQRLPASDLLEERDACIPRKIPSRRMPRLSCCTLRNRPSMCICIP